MGHEERAAAPVLNRRGIVTLDLPGQAPAICRLSPVRAAPDRRFTVRRELAPATGGVLMMLRIRVLDAAGRPLPGAVLEITHRPPSAPGEPLRGAQVTDPHGYAEFKTVFPGWDAEQPAGMDLLLHLAGARDGGRLDFPGQLAVQIAALPPYRRNPAPVPPPGPRAGIPQVVPRDRYDLSAGLLATINAVTGR
ncbi:peptidase associated/transthyretin-like domain-containing protein [Actinoplanes siamensis]|uniref:Uncharacterized protein n=1 Tax=Actinoplanes siamensis TaxID=1223317 RepID=A0A919K931_9ACTN|nr:hypothetical protein [Actinoplanes siamensis]GIF03276.1 hypothetical protein Asi03nite_08140 [Actinoplanes siamensis]